MNIDLRSNVSAPYTSIRYTKQSHLFYPRSSPWLFLLDHCHRQISFLPSFGFTKVITIVVRRAVDAWCKVMYLGVHAGRQLKISITGELGLNQHPFSSANSHEARIRSQELLPAFMSFFPLGSLCWPSRWPLPFTEVDVAHCCDPAERTGRQMNLSFIQPVKSDGEKKWKQQQKRTAQRNIQICEMGEITVA